jgi:hypothetical protein
MKKNVRIILLFIMILCPFTAWSGDISKGSLDKLMALSGLNRQVSDLPAIVQSNVDASSQQESSVMPDDVSADLTKEIKKAFSASEILNVIGLEIKQNLSESEARSMLEWYESDIGKKIIKAEEAASTPAAQDEMMRNATILIGDQNRLALAEKIENILHATDISIQINEGTAFAAFTAFSIVKEPGQREDVKVFKSGLSEKMQTMKSHIQEMVIVSNIYIYKDIDTAGIEKYIKFLESPAARKFNNALTKGIEKALKQATDKMAKSFAADFKKYNESSKKP